MPLEMADTPPRPQFPQLALLLLPDPSLGAPSPWAATRAPFCRSLAGCLWGSLWDSLTLWMVKGGALMSTLSSWSLW